jgi:hypothetical protein
VTEAQLLLLWSDMNQIGVIHLRQQGAGYRFRIVVDYSGRPGPTTEASGTVTADGSVDVERHARLRPSQLNCPICLARGTRIATPTGQVAVEDVRVGAAVWTADASGHRIRASILRVGQTPVPSTHEVVRFRLADGRSVLVSPGHPTSDGRLVGELRVGDRLDGSRVVGADRVPYSGRFTYDLLPSGPTGTYFANGVLLGSTLARVRV